MTARPLQPPASGRARFLRTVPAWVGASLVALVLGVWALASGASSAACGWAGLALGASLLVGLGSALTVAETTRFRLAVVTMLGALGGAGVIAAAYAL
ncbi:MAG: hypothetical protein LBE25_04550 [Arthrobacter sp.]|nr:hypothetical protein [Arthrobacter sp.]